MRQFSAWGFLIILVACDGPAPAEAVTAKAISTAEETAEPLDAAKTAEPLDAERESGSASRPQAEDQAAFAARCRRETLAQNPQSAPWVDGACTEKWGRAQAAAPMAARLMAASRGEAAGAPMENLEITAGNADGARHLSFYWTEIGGMSPYDLPAALRVRGVPLETLGCPQFGMASAGQEKIFRVLPPGAEPFVLTVYSRAAALGSEPGFYEVDAEFGGTAPDMAALRRGAYPGGGGRAFAPEAENWTADCPDPE